MFKKYEYTENRESQLASISIFSLKSFNDLNFDKLKRIVNLFNLNKLFFNLEITLTNKDNVCSDLIRLEDDSNLEISFDNESVFYESSVEKLGDVFQIIKKFDMEESIFFQPDDISWEEFLLNDKNEELYLEQNNTNAWFSIYDQDGNHHLLFRTDKYDFKKIIDEIEKILAIDR